MRELAVKLTICSHFFHKNVSQNSDYKRESMVRYMFRPRNSILDPVLKNKLGSGSKNQFQFLFLLTRIKIDLAGICPTLVWPSCDSWRLGLVSRFYKGVLSHQGKPVFEWTYLWRPQLETGICSPTKVTWNFSSVPHKSNVKIFICSSRR